MKLRIWCLGLVGGSLVGLTAQASPPCDMTAFEAACKPVAARVAHDCDHAGEQISDPKWLLERARGLGETQRIAAALDDRWRACFAQRSATCPSPDRYVATCQKASDLYADNWAGYVASSVAVDERDLAGFARRPAEESEAVLADIARLDAEITAVLAVNAQLPAGVKADTSRLEAVRTAALAAKADIAAAGAKAIASARCPAGSAQDAALLARFRPLVEREFKGGDGLRETVAAVHSDGKPYQTRDAVQRVTHEDAQIFVCVRQVKDDGTRCRSFEMTMRRTKPDGSKFGEWSRFSIGGDRLISCDHLGDK